MLASMAVRPLDVLVVGGGITGAGVALDAALRGLRVGLVEQHDFASGTSSRSSKMIHGGLRYLSSGRVGLVREALRERANLQVRAPHLVRPLPMILPMFGRRFSRSRIKYGTGLWLYDLIGAWKAGGRRHHWINRKRTLELLPNIAHEHVSGGLYYQDAKADDVRLVLAVLRTAVRNGAIVANRAHVMQLIDSDEGRVSGALVRDELSPGSKPIEITAKVVMNCTGVWSDQIADSGDTNAGFRVMPSKGIHLTVDRERLGINSGVAFFAQEHSSNVFAEPWHGDLALIGTTDDAYTGDLSNPIATEDEIATVMARVNEFLDTPLERSDIRRAWAGLRPLIVDANSISQKTKDISRTHKTIERPGLVTLVGGKLTTYRAMAEDGVDAAAKQIAKLDGISKSSIPSSSTKLVRLVGASAIPDDATVERYAKLMGADPNLTRHLLGRYGSDTEIILEYCQKNPAMAQRLHPQRPYIRAEVVFACEHEMAIDAGDIFGRRTRLSLEFESIPVETQKIVEELLGS